MTSVLSAVHSIAEYARSWHVRVGRDRLRIGACAKPMCGRQSHSLPLADFRSRPLAATSRSMGCALQHLA